MYKIMNVWDMQEEFIKYGRKNYFSDEGLEEIDNYYIDCYSGGGEVGTEIEFDVVAICRDWNEYGNGVVLDFNDFVNDFEYLVKDDVNNWNDEEKFDAIYEKLEEQTYCIKLDNGNILQMAF